MRTPEDFCPYKVGDTVYLDDTAFLITEIRRHSVQLRDPALSYPVSRAESREYFEQIGRGTRLNSSHIATSRMPSSA